MSSFTDTGKTMHALMKRLWPICRSITGDGVRETLAILKEKLPNLKIHEIQTGTECFDWKVPKEWAIRSAYICDADGNKIIDFANNNLHVVNYSTPIDEVIGYEELQKHLHSIPEQPNAIPYVTTYYKESWGFCLSQLDRDKLLPGEYHVHIDSKLKAGSLTYAELILPGESDREIFLSTYVCHPSMANNELSGPCVTSMLGQWLQSKNNFYTYRIIFVPETIGAICYLSRHLKEMQKKMIAGYVITCVGDERAWSLMPSKNGNTYSDAVARHVLNYVGSDYKEYSFLERGSDERQYCSPGVDLPVASIMRSKYATYPEYHTSLDDMNFVTPKGLQESFVAYKKAIEVFELDCIPVNLVLCEPKMSDRGLRPTTGKVGSAKNSLGMMNLIAYADGTRSLLEIAEIINIPVWELRKFLDMLVEANVLEINGR